MHEMDSPAPCTLLGSLHVRVDSQAEDVYKTKQSLAIEKNEQSNVGFASEAVRQNARLFPRVLTGWPMWLQGKSATQPQKSLTDLTFPAA